LGLQRGVCLENIVERVDQARYRLALFVTLASDDEDIAPAELRDARADGGATVADL
jgi:hypothetical protein